MSIIGFQDRQVTDVAYYIHCLQIKILKRQAEGKAASSTTAQTSTASSIQRKSLAEREADYATARCVHVGWDLSGC